MNTTVLTSCVRHAEVGNYTQSSRVLVVFFFSENKKELAILTLHLDLYFFRGNEMSSNFKIINLETLK